MARSSGRRPIREGRRPSRRRPPSSSPTSWPATPTRSRTRSGRAKLALHNGKGGAYRPAAVKTGTSNEAPTCPHTATWRRPPTASIRAWSVGIWMGNSDHSNPRAKAPATSLTAAAPLWQAFVRDYTKGWPVTALQAASGRRPGDDRCVDRGRAGAMDQGAAPPPVHRRHPARRTPIRSIRRVCSTATPVAATAWTWSRPSSGPPPGTPTTPTGCAGRGTVPARAGTMTRARRTSGASRRGAAPSPARARNRVTT